MLTGLNQQVPCFGTHPWPKCTSISQVYHKELHPFFPSWNDKILHENFLKMWARRKMWPLSRGILHLLQRDKAPQIWAFTAIQHSGSCITRTADHSNTLILFCFKHQSRNVYERSSQKFTYSTEESYLMKQCITPESWCVFHSIQKNVFHLLQNASESTQKHVTSDAHIDLELHSSTDLCF